jgi:general secretion pathway protein G|tara:strand:- start:3460 stop:3900 length:441 start_codon:yes stop_codon:yes gene_type:complete
MMIKKNKSGFTLIELMAVIVILGILATIVAINVAPFLQRANLEKMRADISTVEKALELYKFNEMRYPSTQQGLEALVIPPKGLKRGYLYPENGYINSVPIDPWGQEYLYLSPGQKSKRYDIYSLGADGLEGGVGDNADIGNWISSN